MPENDTTRPGAGASHLFLREDRLREAQDMLFLAWRDVSASADALLDEAGLGRAHHRALHFIGRAPGLSVSELLGVLGITKQSLSRVLDLLEARGLVSIQVGRNDRRQRLLRLTEDGVALERTLFERQRERLLLAYREAGGPAVEGFRRVLEGVMTQGSRAWLEQTRPDASRRTP